MANEPQLPEWTADLKEAIDHLISVHTNMSLGNLYEASDFLTAARAVSDAIELLQPKTKEADGAPTPDLQTSLVRGARAPRVGKSATWAQIAESQGLPMAQRGFDLFSEGKAARLAGSKKRTDAYREQIPAKPRPVLPGKSMSEMENLLGVSRTRVRALVAAEELHAYPLLNPDGSVVTSLRAGKQVPTLRYYPANTGMPAAQAAEALGVSESAVAEMGAAGEIGRSKVRDEKTGELAVGTDGEPVWAYWPDHKKVLP